MSSNDTEMRALLRIYTKTGALMWTPFSSSFLTSTLRTKQIVCLWGLLNRYQIFFVFIPAQPTETRSPRIEK